MDKAKVIILCGGSGSRLRPITSDIPKPLVQLRGKPVLQHIIEFFVNKGLDDFVLCTGFKSDMISEFISSQQFQARIKIENSGEGAGMLKRLYYVRNLIDRRAIVAYGDTFIDLDVERMIGEHDSNGAKMTITVTDIMSPFGLVKINSDNDVIEFQEKPLLPHYIGSMIIDKEILDNLDRDLIDMPDGSGLVSLFQRLISAGRLRAYRHTGLQITFNTLHEYRKAEEEFIKFFTEQGGRT